MEIIHNNSSEYAQVLVAAKAIKDAIVESRYKLAKIVNSQAITLYYNIGRYISSKSRLGSWGTSAIKTLSTILRQELPGLHGFSETSIKDMRIFYEEWQSVFEDRQLTTAELGYPISADSEVLIIRQLTTADLTAEQLEQFLKVPFTHHREILRKTVTLEERLFYINKCATEFWQVPKLIYALKDKLYKKEGIQATNFSRILPDELYRRKALAAFKDNYLFDFVDFVDDDDLVDEKNS